MTTPLQHTLEIDSSSDYQFLYEGLARQKIEFHQALAELIDNAISAKAQAFFRVEILLESIHGLIRVTVADNGKGISADDLKRRVLRLGGKGSNPGALNEHGFGLKNSLCLLTGNRREFKIVTASADLDDKEQQWVVDGPFRHPMQGRLEAAPEWTRNLSLATGATGTRIVATTTREYLKTAYPRGTRLAGLAERVCEHVAVIYRHWLAVDRRNEIWLRWKDEEARWQECVVPRIKFSIRRDFESFEIPLGVEAGTARATFVKGMRDAKLIEGEGAPYPLMIYYQGTERTQGVDIIVRNKVILPHQIEELWPEQIRRRERNQFLGELLLEGDAFRTVNNKIDLDPHDPMWQQIKEKLQDAKYLPPQYSISRTEATIAESIVDLLTKFVSESHAQRNYPIWAGTGVKADIVHQANDNQWLDVYEVKDEAAAPQDVYQLIMYWDGLVNDGKSPRAGVLVAETASDSVRILLKFWNGREDLGGRPYKVSFKSIEDMGVRILRPSLPNVRKRR